MIDQITLARPYARAIFETAKQQENYAEWSHQLETLALITENDQVQRLLHDTTLPPQKLEAFYQDIAKTVLTEAGKNLLHLLSLKKRLALLPQINQLFSTFRLQAENTLPVHITTSLPLTEQQKSNFSALLEKRFGKKIIVNATVDGSLMGGYRIKAGDTIIDGSLQGSLKQLNAAMGG